MHVLVAVDEVGRPAEGHRRRLATCVAISIARRSTLSRRVIAARIILLSGRKWPWRSGAKPSLSGLNGAGQRHVQADARRASRRN